MNINEALSEAEKVQAKQNAEDKVGLEAASTTLPGPMRDVFSPAPDIKVHTWNVRRFVDRDFIFLSALGHPVKKFTDLSNAENFEPTGENAWLLCWLLTRPIATVKESFKSIGEKGIKEASADEFGDQTVFGLSKIVEAIVKQMVIYSSAHVEFEPKTAEGENGSNPPPPLSLP